MATLFLCGAGNSEGVRLAMVIGAAQGGWDRIVLLDDDPAVIGTERIGVPVVGAISELANADVATDRVANLVARKTKVRALVRDRIVGHGVPFAPLVHPSVDLFGAEIDDDVILYQNVTIGPEVKLAPGVCVFMGAVVGHECSVGACSVAAANSVLNARVHLADRVYVGTNATVLPEISVGSCATIGAGSVLVHDLEAEETAVGVPAEVVSAQALPNVDIANLDVRAEVIAVWQRVLGQREIDPSKSFFDHGGDSLGALRVRNGLRTALGVDLPVVTLFQFPTVGALTAHLTGEPAAAALVGRERAERRRDAMARRRAVNS